MKTGILATACLLFFVIAVAILESATAQTVTIGVNPGSVFTYSYTLLWDSTNQNAIIPPEYIELNQTQSIQITITSVSGSLINLDVNKIYKNGTTTTESGITDVDKQKIDTPYSFLIIRANANPGEKIYPSGGYATFTETELRTYQVGQIETINYIKEETSLQGYEKTEIFFDRATGAATEYQNEISEIIGNYETTTKETLILESRTLATKIDYTIYLIPLVIIIATLLVLFLARKLRKPTIPKTEQHIETDNTHQTEE
jgi:hypothetical protein